MENAADELLKPLLLKSVKEIAGGERIGLPQRKVKPGALFFSLNGRRGRAGNTPQRPFKKEPWPRSWDGIAPELPPVGA